MALEAMIKYGLQRLAQAFRDYAPAQGWGPEDYQVYVRLKLLWGRIHVILVAKALPDSDEKKAWLSVWNFLQAKLKDEPDLIATLNLDVRTFEQVKAGGWYALSPKFVEIKDLLISGPVEDPYGPSPFAARSGE
jgi:hypothetical protein